MPGHSQGVLRISRQGSSDYAIVTVSRDFRIFGTVEDASDSSTHISH
jgi:hypothetical protein